MSHHKHLDSPLMKLEQYLFSYSRPAAHSHPAGEGICEILFFFYPLIKKPRKNESLAGGLVETLDHLTFWKQEKTGLCVLKLPVFVRFFNYFAF